MNKYKIASILNDMVSNEKMSFNSSLKAYAPVDRFLSRKLSNPQKNVRKELLKHMLEATDPKNKVCWSSVLFPSELLYAAGIVPLTLEVIAGLFSTLGLARNFLDISDASDVPNTMCSFHRTLLGLSKTEYLGKPALVGATSVLCDGNLKSFSAAAKNQNAPFIFLDVPYEDSTEAVHYLKEQLKNAVNIISDIVGRKITEEDMRRVVKSAGKSFGLLAELYSASLKSRRNLYRGHEIANFAFPVHFMLGSERLNGMIVKKLDAVKKQKGRNRIYKKALLDNKCRRLMWLHIVPQYDTEIWPIVDNGVSSKIVCDEYSSLSFAPYNPADPLGSIARRLITHPSNGPIERRIRHITKVARDYNVDGIIHYSSWGCHQAAGNVSLLGKKLMEKGFKFISINGDPIDVRNTSTEQHRTRLEAFLE